MVTRYIVTLAKRVCQWNCNKRTQYESHDVSMFHCLIHFEPRFRFLAGSNVVQHIVAFR